MKVCSTIEGGPDLTPEECLVGRGALGGPGDELRRFYTVPSVATLLVNAMRTRRPRSVLDIGAGGGCLTEAASRRWKNAHLVTVDLDEGCAEPLRHLLGSGGFRHVHHTHDALDPFLPDLVAKTGAVDAAICNPPFRRPKWRQGYEQVLEEAGLDQAFSTTADVTAEVLFLAQNMRIVGRGGAIGVIVPDGLVTGVRSREFRRTLLTRHKVDAVVQLPAHSFRNTDAQAYVIVFRNRDGESRSVRLMRFDKVTGLSVPLLVDRDAAAHRMDYSSHSAGACNAGTVSLRDLGAEVRRGSINATRARAEGVDVLHTSDLDPEGDIRLALDGVQRDADAIFAEPGDIVMARIDRTLHRKIALVVSGRRMITDCVYRIRLPGGRAQQVLDVMRSGEGARQIEAATRGVAARHLGKEELLTLPLLPREILR